MDLVFKNCANQNFKDSNDTSLKTLLGTLISQSSVSKFYNSSSDNGGSAINGLFQCRSDLSNDECANCVKNISGLTQKLCGQSVRVRVQLKGCYMRYYEVSGFRQENVTEPLFNFCDSNRVSGNGVGDMLGLALGEIGKRVMNDVNGGLFYTGVYQSVYVLVQCEGDLSRGECVRCVKSAIDKAKSECGSSISAKIYLQECFISYTYYPLLATGKHFHRIIGRNTQKIVAIVLGGRAIWGGDDNGLLFVHKISFQGKAACLQD
ncbi:hypothetical protein CASFOL_010173 [Castilleja foliolosa]|uniref:Gnk2-homologous domain-containing protein n=1 Tax=Castilleja foliolosa TaxID=1961234 RepID=A0ABD3DRT6_9LAMI